MVGFAKIIMGMYTLAAVYMLVVQATWEQRVIVFVYACSEGIFSVPGLLTAVKNLSNATAPNSLINMISSNTALVLKCGHLQKRAILQFFLRRIKRQKLVSTVNDSTLRPSPFITLNRPRSAKRKPISMLPFAKIKTRTVLNQVIRENYKP